MALIVAYLVDVEGVPRQGTQLRPDDPIAYPVRDCRERLGVPLAHGS